MVAIGFGVNEQGSYPLLSVVMQMDEFAPVYNAALASAAFLTFRNDFGAVSGRKLAQWTGIPGGRRY